MGDVENGRAGSVPSVSVVICTHNRAGRLERALRALGAQRRPAGGFEIVVVDDGSSDETPQVCRRLAARMPDLRYVSTGENLGLSPARNRGVAAARGDLILFVDDDCIPAPDWVLRMTESLRRRPVVAGAVATPSGGFAKLCHNVAQFYGFMPCQRAGPVALIAGANMGFRREVLEDVGGFRDSRGYAEDIEFILRARARGYAPYFDPRAIVTHDPDRSTLRGIFAYSASHAASTVHLRNTYRDVLHTPGLLRSPVLLLAAAPAIALAVTLRIYLSSPWLARCFWTAPIVYGLKFAWCVGAAQGLRHPPVEYADR
jgi:GT2 family glycosyltransferase